MGAGNIIAKVETKGKHTNRPNKNEDSMRDNIKAQIRQFPNVQLHYSRNHSLFREYFSPSLSLAKMYLEYISSLLQKEHDRIFVKQSFYNKVFSENFNLDFGSPISDTVASVTWLTTMT